MESGTYREQDLRDLFEKVCQYCIENKIINQSAYNLWLQPAALVALKDNFSTAVLQVSHDFAKGVIESKFKDKLAAGFESILGFPIDIEVQVANAAPAAAVTEAVKADITDDFIAPSIYSETKTDADGNYEFSFDTFIVGPSNKFAHAASMAVASNPANAYNPLFIYGGSGLGKTHLLFSIASSIRKRYPNYRIVYIKSEDFMNELVDALQTGFSEFRAKYRQADLLLMDDVQFLSGKVQLQEEFFHTFEALFQANRQIVLTSDRPPKEIATLSDRLHTRFESGLLADIQSPDLETRMAMVKAKANNLGIEMPQKVVAYIAENITNNVRELEGAVKKIAAINGLMGSPIDLPMAQNAIKDIFKERPGLNPTPEMILKEVSEFYSVPLEKLTGKARNKEVVIARQVAEYLMRELASMSFPEIGKVLDQHHTSVMYGIETLTKSMAKDENLRDSVNDLKKNIQSK